MVTVWLQIWRLRITWDFSFKNLDYNTLLIQGWQWAWKSVFSINSPSDFDYHGRMEPTAFFFFFFKNSQVLLSIASPQLMLRDWKQPTISPVPCHFAHFQCSYFPSHTLQHTQIPFCHTFLELSAIWLYTPDMQMDSEFNKYIL